MSRIITQDRAIAYQGRAIVEDSAGCCCGLCPGVEILNSIGGWTAAQCNTFPTNQVQPRDSNCVPASDFCCDYGLVPTSLTFTNMQYYDSDPSCSPLGGTVSYAFGLDDICFQELNVLRVDSGGNPAFAECRVLICIVIAAVQTGGGRCVRARLNLDLGLGWDWPTTPTGCDDAFVRYQGLITISEHSAPLEKAAVTEGRFCSGGGNYQSVGCAGPITRSNTWAVQPNNVSFLTFADLTLAKAGSAYPTPNGCPTTPYGAWAFEPAISGTQL